MRYFFTDWMPSCVNLGKMVLLVATIDAVRRAKLQSNRNLKQTNIQLFYRPDALPVANRQCQSTPGINQLSADTRCVQILTHAWGASSCPATVHEMKYVDLSLGYCSAAVMPWQRRRDSPSLPAPRRRHHNCITNTSYRGCDGAC